MKEMDTKKFKKPNHHKKRNIAIIVTVIVLLLLTGGGVAVYFLFFNQNQPADTQPDEPAKPVEIKNYSVLTGLEISDASLNNSPTYCMQIPNGNDGARPQVGLSEAGVVFEAIAEAGITRFAAIFQNPQGSVIGPIRSLRPYYLEWDTPFNCTIVHAGGSYEALQALKTGKHRDLTENYTYMYRDTSAYWSPNNLMTSSELLKKHSEDNSYTSSVVKGFPRLKPEDAKEVAEDNKANSEETPLVENISVNFGNLATYNTIYTYDATTNTYLRSFQSGAKHLTYNCPAEYNQPRPKGDCGDPVQVAPSAVAVMMVDQYLDKDNYHQVIETIGSGLAYVFQNGTAIKGTWNKAFVDSQIVFKTEDGEEIYFTPGQLWIAAVPHSGSVKY